MLSMSDIGCDLLYKSKTVKLSLCHEDIRKSGDILPVLTTVLDKVEWSASHHFRFTPEERTTPISTGYEAPTL
jgi:hypothetical protein